MMFMDKTEIQEYINNEVTRQVKEALVNFSGDKNVIDKNTQYLDGRNIQTGRTNGTKLGTASDQKLGFFGTTPVDQPETVADASGCNGDADDKLNQLIDRLQELGIIQ